ncbi:hypothetical protein D3C76_1559920 [compost metagenome]
MSARRLPVHPYLGDIIHRLKVQDDSLSSRFLRDRHALAVPHPRMEILQADAASLGFVRKRNLDFMRSRELLLPLFGFADILIVEAEVPFAVQVHPFVSDELGSWIIFDIALGCHLAPPESYLVLISSA